MHFFGSSPKVQWSWLPDSYRWFFMDKWQDLTGKRDFWSSQKEQKIRIGDLTFDLIIKMV